MPFEIVRNDITNIQDDSIGEQNTSQLEQLIQNVRSFIDEHYVEDYEAEIYSSPIHRDRMARYEMMRCEEFLQVDAMRLSSAKACATTANEPDDLATFLKQKDDTFSVTLVDLIERSGKKNSEIYKKANVDKKLFSKIINNVKYHPSKQTAIAFAIALELDLEETQDLIGRAGYTLTHSSKFDLIIEFFILNKNYNIFEINEVLFEFDEVPLGY